MSVWGRVRRRRDEVDKKIRAHFGIGAASGATVDGAAKTATGSPKQEAADKAAVPPAIAAGKSRTGARATKK
jgi:hypothetical protein